MADNLDTELDIVEYIDKVKEYVQSFHEFSFPFGGKEEIAKEVKEACYRYVFTSHGISKEIFPKILAVRLAKNLLTYTEMGARQYEHGISSALIVEQLLIDKWLTEAINKKRNDKGGKDR